MHICKYQGKPCLYKDFRIAIDKFVCLDFGMFEGCLRNVPDAVEEPRTGEEILTEFLNGLTDDERQTVKEYVGLKREYFDGQAQGS